jgi:Flp pilus assembly pilin Flp
MRRSMTRLLRSLLADDRAQDLAEYGIALAIIAIGVAAISVAIGTDVQTLWSNAQPDIRNVIDSE